MFWIALEVLGWISLGFFVTVAAGLIGLALWLLFIFLTLGHR